jgi:IclR family pca regulon transcriptional regulator
MPLGGTVWLSACLVERLADERGVGRQRRSNGEVMRMDEEQQSRRSAKRGTPPKRRASTPLPVKPRIETTADPRRSRSLEYGIAILECYSGEHVALGIAQLAQIVGISRSTAHRYAMTLVALGYLEQDSKRRYRLANHAADPGRVAIDVLRGELAARAVLEELRDELGYTVSVGVLSGTRAIYLYRLFGHRRGQHAIDRNLESGASVPLYCTALGKVLLAALSNAERSELLAEVELVPQGPKAILDRRKLAAALERIGARDAVVCDEEHVEGARSVAVPVPRSRGQHPLAIEVTVPADVYSASRLLKEVGPRLKRAAKLISGG